MKLKHWIKIVIFTILTGFLLIGATIILVVPYHRDSACMFGFWLEPDNSLDVMLLGPSNVYTSFYSPLAYEKEGFTSFAFSIAGMPASSYETAVEEILTHQDPDLFVVELWGFQYGNQFSEKSLHTFLDVLPLNSPVRENAINTIVPEEMRDSFRNPLLKYHENWTNVIDCVRVLIDKLTISRRGFSVTKNYTNTTTIMTESANRKYNINEDGMNILDSFLDFCRDKGIDHILFIRGPEQYYIEPQPSYYEALEKIEEAGYDFLDMNAIKEQIGITDEHEWQHESHLNVFGTEKYTEYLSAYIMDHYEINTEHSEQVKEEWNYCASLNDDILGFLKIKSEDHEDIYRYTQTDLLAGVKNK